jgi:hypothetical protein
VWDTPNVGSEQEILRQLLVACDRALGCLDREVGDGRPDPLWRQIEATREHVLERLVALRGPVLAEPS